MECTLIKMIVIKRAKKTRTKMMTTKKRNVNLAKMTSMKNMSMCVMATTISPNGEAEIYDEQRYLAGPIGDSSSQSNQVRHQHFGPSTISVSIIDSKGKKQLG